MPTRTVKRPGALKWARVLPEEEAILAQGVTFATGLRREGDPEGTPQQLDVRHINNKTFVTPIGGADDLQPWTHLGYIGDQDCVAFYRANAAALRTSQPEGNS